MTQQLVDFVKQPDGRLRIQRLSGQDVTDVIAEIQARCGRGTDNAYLEVIEYQLQTGWEVLSEDDKLARGDLYSGLILTDDTRRDERGDLLASGRVYYYNSYALRSEINEIETAGFVILDGNGDPLLPDGG